MLKKPVVHFNLPKFCDFFRFFLVEEIALWNNPITLHYGKCSVIGRLINDKNGRLCIENCKILSISKEYQLDDGLVLLPVLVNDICEKVPIPKNVYAELYGEVVLLKKNNCAINDEKESLTNSCILMEQVRALQIQMEADCGLPKREPSGFGDSGMKSKIRMALKCLVNKFKNTYEPTLQLYSFQVIDQPHELIACNLEIRAHREK